MPVPNNTPIKFSEIRAEGNKTSWVSPDYPNAGRQFNINPNWIISVDQNNQVGYNPSDGSFSVSQMQGWDTWRKPNIAYAKIQQYDSIGNVRIGFAVRGGDPIRSGYALFRSTQKSEVTGTPNPSAFVRFLQYGPEVDQLSKNAVYDDGNADSWDDYNLHGNYGDNLGSGYYAPDTGQREPQLILSFIDILSGSPTGEGPYYYAIAAVDMRKFDFLGAKRGDNTFSLNRPENLGSYPERTISTLATVDAGPDNEVGDSGLIVFSNYNGINTIASVYSINVETNNNYRWYLQTENPLIWYAVDTETSKEFPDSWTAQTLPLNIGGLESNKQYKIWVAAHRETDNNAPSSQTTIETAILITDDAIPNAPNGLVFTSKQAITFGLEWCHVNNNGVSPTSYTIDYNNLNNSAGPLSQNVQAAGSGKKSATLNIDESQHDPGDQYQIRIRANGPDGASSPGNTISTDIDGIENGANC